MDMASNTGISNTGAGSNIGTIGTGTTGTGTTGTGTISTGTASTGTINEIRRPRRYHIGLLKEEDMVVVQMRRDVDTMDPGLWRYWGVCYTTKRRAREVRQYLLESINKQYGTSFSRILID